ncbi:MAG: hypothetical protein WC375_03015 [Methanomassiliicoccales archaeon]
MAARSDRDRAPIFHGGTPALSITSVSIQRPPVLTAPILDGSKRMSSIERQANRPASPARSRRCTGAARPRRR